jgi:hypothetical protein
MRNHKICKNCEDVTPAGSDKAEEFLKQQETEESGGE